MADTGPRGGRCSALSFHMHVGVCERAGYRNGAADALDRIAAALEAGEDVAELVAELRKAWHLEWAAELRRDA